MLANGVLVAIAMVPPFYETNLYDVVDWSAYMLLTVAGVTYLFRRNGGTNGRRFMERAMSIMFVMTIRWVVLLVIPVAIVYMALLEWQSEIPEQTTAGDILISAASVVLLYWRSGVHIGQLAADVSPEPAAAEQR